MKKYIYITVLALSSLFKINAQSITSNIGTPSSRYTLEANTNYDIYLRAYVDVGASIKGFKTTLDDEYLLEWNFNTFGRDEWVNLKHNITTTQELISPVFKIDLISDGVSGVGVGEFYIDDIRIVKNTSLSNDLIENRIRVYPNPISGGVLYVENVKNLQNLTLYSLNGNQVKSVSNFTSTNKQSMQVGSLEPGVYMLKITTDNSLEVKKVIIN